MRLTAGQLEILRRAATWRGYFTAHYERTPDALILKRRGLITVCEDWPKPSGGTKWVATRKGTDALEGRGHKIWRTKKYRTGYIKWQVQ